MSELIADIAVNAPLKQLYSYLVPEPLQAETMVGMRVKIPFGRRLTIGYVVTLRKGSGEGLKALKELLDEQPLLSKELLQLLRWGAEYYCHPLGQVIRSALPADLGSEKGKTKILHEPFYRPMDNSSSPSGEKQRKILAHISQQGQAGLSDLRQQFDAPHASLKRLVELGFLEQAEQEKQRDPFLSEPLPADKPLSLTAEQGVAVTELASAIASAEFKPYLLHGVTGSGKTEVYLRAAEACLKQNRTALILVPEISLTPQLVARFRARFEPTGVRLAVMHSGLSPGERFDAWRLIGRGEAKIVIGARSAVFAPSNDIGLIVVDEEHDSSYKQAEGFRYNARDLALVRGQQQQCPIVLGSATPSFNSYFRSETGMLTKLSLTKRTHAGLLPAVELIDLKDCPVSGSLSNKLVEALQETLENQQQALLLLNRRGYAPFLLCTDCGTSFHCPNCEITLTYHQNKSQIRCHYCDYAITPPESCPRCAGANIAPEGAGTERLEEELEELFPGVRVGRMDRDTTTRKGAHQRLVNKMMAQEIDILVGTQMIAKGHDFPNVSLVGVLGADSILNLPDFRAAERCFSLLTQVAGRAGREHGGGRVLIQTYAPEHYALTCAAQQDYKGFYQLEIPFRQELGYPPVGHLVNLVFTGNNIQQVQSFSTQVANRLMNMAKKTTEILGPSPCPLARLRGKNRFQILMKTIHRAELRSLLAEVENYRRKTAPGVGLYIDVDPVDMF